jgi:sigma-B regulation protein RsbU (phosphoserine phosphatase)
MIFSMSDAAPNPPAPSAAPDQLAHLRHELRTPLNQIIGYSEMLEEEANDAGQTSFVPDLQKIQKAARHLAEVITENLNPGKFQGTLNRRPSAAVAPGSEPLNQVVERLDDEDDADSKRAQIPGHLLVVDDNEANRDMLSRRLQKQGFTVETAENGLRALEQLRATSYDLVLLDIMMPELDGFAVLERLKSDNQLRHIPVIMISALDELESVVRCIQIGAEDYLPKPFNPTLLRARIGASLEKKHLRDQEQKTYQALVASQAMLAAELSEAAEYVKSLLPATLTEPIRTEWRFVPSTQLGGDSFGYHWLDENRFAMYLLDVCGHGVGAALLSISAMNVLRSQSLPATNFGDPGSVLCALNEAFPMENQNNMYFTIWYGVYNRATRRIVYASGGHPPAVLVSNSGGKITTAQLRTQGMVIGSLSGLRFPTAESDVPPGSRLFIFSDGTYELTKPDGSMMELDEFVKILAGPHPKGEAQLDDVIAAARRIQGKDGFEDDYSLMKIAF